MFIRVFLIAALAMVVGGFGLCPDPLTAAYAAPSSAPSLWDVVAPTSIQLSDEAYTKQLALCDFGCDWFAPYQPVYHTQGGTEMVRGFLGTPAFLSRSLILEADIGTEGGSNDWMSLTGEFAFTRRLQLNATLPMNLGDGEIPFGSVGGRALLFDTGDLLVSTDLDITFNSSTVDVTPTINAWYDIGEYFAVQTTIGGRFLEDYEDQFLWVGGVSRSFALGTTGRWDAILEGGYMDNNWVTSLGVVKPLEFLTPDLDVRTGVIWDWDDETLTVNIGLNYRF